MTDLFESKQLLNKITFESLISSEISFKLKDSNLEWINNMNGTSMLFCGLIHLAEVILSIFDKVVEKKITREKDMTFSVIYSEKVLNSLDNFED